MSIRNKVQLIGHVGMNPEIKSFDNGGKLAKFSIATNENYKDKNGEWQEITTWHNLVGWRYVADRIETQITKGTLVMIEGKLKNRKYQDADNNTRYITEVEVENFIALDSKKSKNEDKMMATASHAPSDFDDDLPF